MAQWVKVIATKPDNLSGTHGIHYGMKELSPHYPLNSKCKPLHEYTINFYNICEILIKQKLSLGLLPLV